MNKPKYVSAMSGILGIALSIVFSPAFSESISFSGQLDLIELDAGGAVYSGTPIGTNFNGFIDDMSADGQISDGTTTTGFGCCIAAGD